jgi:hypothetical protein
MDVKAASNLLAADLFFVAVFLPHVSIFFSFEFYFNMFWPSRNDLVRLIGLISSMCLKNIFMNRTIV